MEIVGVPIITLLVYWCMELIKQLTNNNENFKRFIPICSTALGIILGVIIFYAFPSMKIAENVLYAIGIGGLSGLAATGSNQIIKQLSKYKQSNTDNTNENKTDENTK